MAGVRLVSFTPHCTTRNGMKIAPSCAPLFLFLGTAKVCLSCPPSLTYTLLHLPPFLALTPSLPFGISLLPNFLVQWHPRRSLPFHSFPVPLSTNPATTIHSFIHSLLNKSCRPPFSPTQTCSLTHNALLQPTGRTTVTLLCKFNHSPYLALSKHSFVSKC